MRLASFTLPGVIVEFSEINTEICNAIGDLKQSKLAIVKSVVNHVYLNEVSVCDPLWPLYWLLDFVDDKKSVSKMTITGVTAAEPPVVSVVNSLSDGDIVSIYNISGMTQLNNRTFKVASRAAGNIELQTLDGVDIDASGYDAYTSGGSLVHRGITLSGVSSIWSTPKWHGEYKMERISVQELEETTKWWDESPARPERFFHRKAYASNAEINQLLWFRGADAAYDLRFWKIKPLEALSGNTDVPSMPAEFHPTIVAGVVARLAEVRKDAEMPFIWPTIYENGLEAIRMFNRRWWNERGMPA